MTHFTRHIVCSASLLVLATGCMSSSLSVRDPEAQSTYGVLTRASAMAATQPDQFNVAVEPMRKPARLAVAEMGEVAPPQSLIDSLQKMTANYSSVQGMPALPQVGSECLQNGRWVATNYQPMLDQYRSIARGMNADYLLIMGGMADTVEEPTVLSFLDLTIVGLFACPTHAIHGNVKAVAIAVDVRTGKAVAVHTVQSKRTSLSTAIGIDSNRVQLLDNLRDDAADKLAKDIGKGL